MDQWYYSVQGKDPAGPCTLDELKQLVAGGKVGGNDQVWNAKANEWLPVSKVAELSGHLGAMKEGAPKNAGPAKKPARAAEPPVETRAESRPEPRPEVKTEPSTASSERSGGFFSTLHGALPKPVLFGIYGGIGGLLGALLFGELIWWLTAPAVERAFRMEASPAVTIYPGNQNKLEVKIARFGIQGPIRLVAVDVPPGITIADSRIPEGKSEAELQVTADPKVELGEHDVKVRAVSAADNVEILKDVKLKVEAPPPLLKVEASEFVTIYAGNKNSFFIQLARDNFEGPVRIEVLDLPKGVTIPLLTIPGNPKNLAEITPPRAVEVVVAKEADAGLYPLEIEAHSLANHKISTRTKINLTIAPPPAKLQMSIPTELTLYPGESNKCGVKVGRAEFNSPVRIEVLNPPSGIKIGAITILPKETDGELIITAGNNFVDQPASTHDLQVLAKALDDEAIAVVKPLKLKIEPPPPTVQMAFSPKVSVYAGNKATFGIKVERYRFKGPIDLKVGGKSKDFTLAAVTIPADKSEALLEITAEPSTLTAKLPKTQSLPILATFAGKATSTQPVQVEILAPPSDLRLSASPEVEVYQGGRCRFSIKAARGGFIGPVKLDFNNLPEGFIIDPVNIPANVDEAVIDAQALLRTPVGKHKIEVVGTGPKAADGKIPTDKVVFQLDVKPVDPSKRPPPLDVVFLLDVSNSMDPQIKGVRDGVAQFIAELNKNELEARVGLVAFRDITFDEVPLKVLDFNGNPFTEDLKLFSAEVDKLKATGGGDEPESSLDALARAADMPFRDNAYRVFLLITDAGAQTKANSTTLPVALKLLKEKKIDQLHLVCNEPHRPLYQQLQAVSKGAFFDLTKSAGGPKTGFASMLPVLSKAIARTSVAVGPETPLAKSPPPLAVKEVPSLVSGEAPPPAAEKPPTPPPASKPESPTSVSAKQVEVPALVPLQGAQVTPPPATVIQGVQSTQGFAAEDFWQLLFAVALWTAAAAAGIGVTLVAGQKLYLQKTWPRLAEIAKVTTAGIASGLLAGALSQWFLQLGSGAAVWDIIGRVLAWTLLGGLIGGAMGFFVPNLKLRRAFMGGSIGGFVGVIGFTLVTLIANPLIARCVGAALLGFCIGVMVALAELAFRRYWLEVAYGEREIRTVTLGPTTVAVGGDEKLAAVYVPEAAPRALGYRVHHNRVFCENFENDKTIEVTPGDQRKVRNVKITVCSAASARSTGAGLRLVQVRNVNLMDGMPLTAEDIPGLEARVSDGVVALVSKRPNDPNAFLLRNRSKQSWVVTEPDGKKRTIEPGLGIELGAPCEIDFGQVKGKLDPAKV